MDDCEFSAKIQEAIASVAKNRPEDVLYILCNEADKSSVMRKLAVRGLKLHVQDSSFITPGRIMVITRKTFDLCGMGGMIDAWGFDRGFD